MRTAVLAAVLLAGCGGADERGAAPEADAPAVIADAAPADDMALLRTVSAELYRRGALGLGSHIFTDPPMFDVVQCSDLPVLDGEQLPPVDAARQQVAARLAQLEGDLGRAGYARTLWAPALGRLEERLLRIAADGVAAGTDEGRLMAVSEAQQAADADFAAEVEARRRTLQPNAPPIVAEGGCGAGETPHRFELRPADGEARVIRAFSFELCAARRIDPWNTERCRGWVAVRDGGSLALSGTYRVQARWPDGRSLRTDVTAQGFGEDAPPVRLAAPTRRGEGAGA